jgi:hypothetical protein
MNGRASLIEPIPTPVEKSTFFQAKTKSWLAASLVGRISRLEERIAVLERIATDPATRTARDIEALR